MKVVNKNQSSVISIMAHRPMLTLQQLLASSCLRQGLVLESRIGTDEKGVFLSYSVGYADEGALINGTARSEKEPHFLATLSMIEGKMVSELFPPAVRSVQQEPKEGSNVPEEVNISYWKRLLISETDVTQREAATDHSKQGVWVGFDSSGKEIIRVKDGTLNAGSELVDHIQWPVLGARGSCVVVLYRNPDPTPRQQGIEQAAAGVGALTSTAVQTAMSDSAASVSTSSAPSVGLDNVHVDTSKTLGAMKAASAKAPAKKPAAKKAAPVKKTVHAERREAAVKEAKVLKKAVASKNPSASVAKKVTTFRTAPAKAPAKKTTKGK